MSERPTFREDIMPITVGVREFARMSGLCQATIWKMIKRDELRSVMICGRRLIVVDSYREMVAKQLEAL